MSDKDISEVFEDMVNQMTGARFVDVTSLELTAINLIKARCGTSDYEANGCHLDDIIIGFLKASGYNDLAEEINDTSCWRA